MAFLASFLIKIEIGKWFIPESLLAYYVPISLILNIEKILEG
jgi:hypothetical protein